MFHDDVERLPVPCFDGLIGITSRTVLGSPYIFVAYPALVDRLGVVIGLVEPEVYASFPSVAGVRDVEVFYATQVP